MNRSSLYDVLFIQAKCHIIMLPFHLMICLAVKKNIDKEPNCQLGLKKSWIYAFDANEKCAGGYIITIIKLLCKV
jgi:hypothetical protein